MASIALVSSFVLKHVSSGLFFFLIEVELIFNPVLVSGVQQIEYTVHIHTRSLSRFF